ncbi:unnamed protein product [Chrysoparadoxa australica]
MTLHDKKRRLMVRVGRHLTCNPPQLVEAFKATIEKMLDNIIKYPEDPKYRELRAENKVLKNKVTCFHGGREFLKLLGFEKIKQHGEFWYFMTEVDTGFLKDAKSWVSQQCNAATAMTGDSSGICAPCVIKIRLTSGQVFEGGFQANETVGSVYEFLTSSVVNETGEPLLLKGTHVTYPPDKAGITLAEAGLVPRGLLAVVKGKDADADKMAAVRAAARKKEIEAMEALRAVKRAHDHSKETAAKLERERVLALIKEDREKVKMRTQADHEDSDQQMDGVEETKGH